MTNLSRDTPTGTATFNAPSAAGVNGNGLQLSNYAGSDITSSAQEPLPQVLGKWISPRSRGSLGYSLTLLEWRGGMNRLRDQVESGHTRVKDGATLETHYRRTATLPPAMLVQGSGAVSGTVKRQSSYSQLGRLFLATGSTANFALHGEGIGGDPTLTHVTYTPPGDILCMEPIFVGSAPTTERVMFGFFGAAAKIYSGSLTAPVVSATMDTSLSDVYGKIDTELNDNLMLFLTGGGLKTLARSSGDTAAATPVLSNISSPWKALGLIKAAGGEIRAYWIWNHQVMHTDAEGGTPERLDLTLGPILDAVKYRDGLAATDGSRIVYYNGRVFEDTYWRASRSAPPNSDYKLVCFNLQPNGIELIASCMWYDPNAVLPNIWWLESWTRELKAWYQRGVTEQLGATDVPLGSAKSDDAGLITAGSGYIHTRFGGEFASRFFPNQTLDPTTYQGVTREATGSGSSPALLLPDPITYAPKSVDAIYYGGTMPAGSKVTVYVEEEDGSNSISWTFRAPLSPQDRLKTFEKNQSRILNPVIRATVSAGDDPTASPNCLPITVDFSAYLPAVGKKNWIGWR